MDNRRIVLKIINSWNLEKPLNSGFTLIEILVVFTVVAILAGIGIASFVSYSRSEELNQSASNIRLLVNEAKFNSLSVVKTATNDSGTSIACGTASLIGYNVSVILPDTITLTQVCDEITPPDRRIKTIVLPSGITIVSAIPATDCTTVGFGSLSSLASGVPCDIKLSGYGSTKTVSIDASGNASVN